jgi:cell division protein FtsB
MAIDTDVLAFACLLTAGHFSNRGHRMASDRARFSSAFAFIGAAALAAFTIGLAWSVSGIHWSIWVVVAWSLLLALGLFLWGLREATGKNWLGNPTLSMVAAVSGTAIAAVALAFAFASDKDQELLQREQLESLKAQVQATRALEAAVKDLKSTVRESARAASPASATDVQR